MVFQHINDDTLNIKTNSASIRIKDNGAIQVGERTIEGPGEYDITGVGLHVFPFAAIIFAEGLRLAFIWEWSETSQFDDNAEIDVFLLSLEDPKKITTIIKEQDPRLVVLHNRSAAESLKVQDAITLEETNNYKITTQTLPAEERQFVLLQ